MHLYVRHLAWLHATPEGAKKSRLATFKEFNPDSAQLKLPELDGAEYLIGLLHEAGLMSSNGMGPISLSWQEIQAWLEVSEIELTLWERLTIKELSDVYVSELNKATAKDYSAPYTFTDEEIDRVAVENKIRNMLSLFKKKQTEQDAELINEE